MAAQMMAIAANRAYGQKWVKHFIASCQWSGFQCLLREHASKARTAQSRAFQLIVRFSTTSSHIHYPGLLQSVRFGPKSPASQCLLLL
jgi:hypothetical protein